MAERPTRVLLAALTVGVWGLLLRPALMPTPSEAQTLGSQPGTESLVVTQDREGRDRFIYYAVKGQVYKFQAEAVNGMLSRVGTARAGE